MKRKERNPQWSKEAGPRRNGVDRSGIQSSGERLVVPGSWELASVAVCNAFEWVTLNLYRFLGNLKSR
jgi:hypothetical protein